MHKALKKSGDGTSEDKYTNSTMEALNHHVQSFGCKNFQNSNKKILNRSQRITGVANTQ